MSAKATKQTAARETIDSIVPALKDDRLTSSFKRDLFDSKYRFGQAYVVIMCVIVREWSES